MNSDPLRNRSSSPNPEPAGVVRIESIGANLRGRAKLGNKSIEIPYSLPGDVYTVYKFGKRKIFYKWEADFLENRTSSPPCPHFGSCGGCSGQHLEYGRQFALKSEPILRGLEDSGIRKFSTLPAERQYHYRNRMDFAVFPQKVVGLRMAGNFRRIIPLNECPIQSEWANTELDRVKRLLDEFPEIEYDRKRETGFLKYVTLRKSTFTEDSMTIFTFTEDFRKSESLNEVMESAGRISGAANVVFCFNRKKGEVSASGESLVVKGRDFLEERILGRTFKIPFDGFFQPNPREFLNILEFIRPRIMDSDFLVDLFCGSGFFSVLFGERFKSILGVDVVPSSVSSGSETIAKEFPNKNAELLAFDLFHKKGLERMEAASLPWSESVVIADPPRSGLSPELCSFLNRNPVKQLFYVSCNPEKMLSDLRILSDSYEVSDCLLCDPFPQTPHLEAVSLLVPKNR
ncbi:class I SAM-dependent RNA methyltransferase [Leptospira fluminis]|uniref:Class I SAM-dependent RNA methyltransferase n=1 Tax=Leptospira fluminis TaxID=2484979 RepID=A0A4R9GUX0_9LEPT|nr:class I SAM-dependent RNA methyltransferase [Leptospira fluminis]TGK21963.1 class I SAM-dependent RNA methyltransferase [Leptospira fluminis]